MRASKVNAAVDSEQDPSAEQISLTWMGRLIVCGLLSALAGCAGLTQKPAEQSISKSPAESPPTQPATASTVVDTVASSTLTRRNTPDNASSIGSEPLWVRMRHNFALPAQHDPRIEHEVAWLTYSSTHFDSLLERGKPYLFYLVDSVEKRGMPGEIALLPAVESGFVPLARSPEGAAGLWQFMPATGRAMGLRQDWWYDGRRDVIASTEAALDYLDQLQQRFDGDWLKALAAYNAGPWAVTRAVRKAEAAGQPSDFWHLDLPRETVRYVPRLLALANIIKQPQNFGQRLPKLRNQAYFTAVESDGPVDLGVAAQLAKVDLAELRRLNPGFRRSATAPDGPHRLLVPSKKAQSFAAALAELPKDQHLSWQLHRIKSGENLGVIAHRYDVSVSALKQANGLSSDKIRSGKLLRIPTASAQIEPTASNAENSRTRLSYQVKSGDSLYAIARRFGVSIADLKRWNSTGRYLQPGQTLTLYVNAYAYND